MASILTPSHETQSKCPNTLGALYLYSRWSDTLSHTQLESASTKIVLDIVNRLLGSSKNHGTPYRLVCNLTSALWSTWTACTELCSCPVIVWTVLMAALIAFVIRAYVCITNLALLAYKTIIWRSLTRKFKLKTLLQSLHLKVTASKAFFACVVLLYSKQSCPINFYKNSVFLKSSCSSPYSYL